MVEVPAVKVEVPGYGSSGFSLSLNDDDKGVPGKALITAQLPGLLSGSPPCYGLIVGNIPSGIALQAGKQYWIVLNGQGGQSNNLAGWNVNAVDQLHPFLDAVYCAYASKCPKGVGWYPFQQSFGLGTDFHHRAGDGGPDRREFERARRWQFAVVTQTASIPGHLPVISLRGLHRGPLVSRDDRADAGLIRIVNNFTQYANSPYWGWSGYAVCGPQAGCADGAEQWLATAFTPKANHLATRVDVPAEYYQGTNGVELSIYDDAGGVPGKPLRSWHLMNLPGSPCCDAVGGSDKGGIALTGGKQYWIVIGTSAKDATAVAVWGFTEFANVQKHGGTYDVYCSGSGCTNLGLNDNAWNPMTNIYGLAFSVLGK